MDNLRVTIYTRESTLKKPVILAKKMIRDFLYGRELAWQLAVRDIKAQHRQAFLGLIWGFIMPLANTAAWLFIHGAGIVSIKETTLPYPVFVITGTMLWSVFIDTVNAPLRQTSEAKHVLAKINIPPETIVLSGVYQMLYKTLIRIAVLLPVLLLLGVSPSLSLVIFPIVILSLIVSGTVIGLLLTPIGMLYTDVGRGIQLLLQFMMYITPVVFPIPLGGWAEPIMQYNPITPLIVTARSVLTGQPLEYLGAFLMVTIVAVGLLWPCLAVYRATMPIIIERLSA